MRGIAAVSFALAIAVCGACSSSPAPEITPQSKDAETAKLMGCGTYTAPPRNTGNVARAVVNLSFDVDTTGAVERTSVSLGSDWHPFNKPSYADRARQDVLSCRYIPALRNGELIKSRGSMRFEYEY